MTADTGTRIRWHHDELQKLAHHIREQQRTSPGILLLDATRVAQKAVLPPERRRDLRNQKNIGAPLENTLALMGPRPHPLSPPEPAPGETVAPIPEGAAVQLPMYGPGAVKIPREAAEAASALAGIQPTPHAAIAKATRANFLVAVDVLRDIVLEALAQQDAIAGKLDTLTDMVRNLRAALDATKLGARQPTPDAEPEPVAIPERVIPTIGIVGPLPDQFTAIEKKCKALPVKLRQIHPSGNPAFPKTDYVILWVRFLGHRWSDAAFREFDRDRVRLCTGAVVETVAMIEEIAKKQEAAA